MSAQQHLPETKAGHSHDGGALTEWLVVAGLAVLSLVLGTYGFMDGLPGDGTKPQGMVEAFYNSMRLFHMHFEHAPEPLPWELQAARFLAPLVLLATLIKGFVFAARRQHHSLLHLFQKQHVVICGLGQKGLALARQYRARNKWVLVIEKNPANELLATCERESIFCRIGDATDPAVLKQARARHAREIICVTPDDETNVRIALQLRSLKLPSGKERPEGFIHLENIHLRERLQRQFAKDAAVPTGCALKFFDVYDGEARRVLQELPLDGQGITANDPRTVHVAVLGFGRMGRSLALRAAKMGHFANGKKLRISVIDRLAEQHHQQLLFHYPILKTDDLCELRCHQAAAQSLTALELVENWAAEKDTLLSVFVCLDDNPCAVEVGLRLQEALANRPDASLCVRLKTVKSLEDVLKPVLPDGKRITPFGMVENACCESAFRHEYHEAIARTLHEGYRQGMAKLRASGQIIPPRPAEVPWEELREEFKESNRQAADHIAIKARALGYRVGKLDDAKNKSAPIRTLTREQKRILAPMEHARWCAERWLGGWLHDVNRDDDRHRHPDLLPWADLHDAERRIDHAQIEQLADALAAEGLGIFPR